MNAAFLKKKDELLPGVRVLVDTYLISALVKNEYLNTIVMSFENKLLELMAEHSSFFLQNEASAIFIDFLIAVFLKKKEESVTYFDFKESNDYNYCL